jgi:hypothetical protein
VERLGDPEPGRVADRREVRQAQEHRGDRAADQADQHPELSEESSPEPAHQHHDQDDAARQRELRRCGVVRGVRVVAGDQPGRDTDQRQADDRDHRAGDDRREEPDGARERHGDEQTEHTGREHRAVDGLHAVLARDQDHRRDGGERRARHDRQPDAEDVADAERLHQRDQARHQQVGVDQ